MKYLKYFENINLNDIDWVEDWEEEDPHDPKWKRFKIGDFVNHPRFGRGEIIEIVGDYEKFIIRFDDGRTLLILPNVAKFTKIK